MLDTAFNNTISDTIEVEDKIYINLDETDQESIMEPGMKTIKDMVAQMPLEIGYEDEVLDHVLSKKRIGFSNFCFKILGSTIDKSSE